VSEAFLVASSIHSLFKLFTTSQQLAQRNEHIVCTAILHVWICMVLCRFFEKKEEERPKSED
jgi:hypothetical protein